MTGFLLPLLLTIGPWAIALIALVVFAESGILAGFFLPGDSLLFTAGVLIAAGVIHVPLFLAVCAFAVAAFLGDQLGYTIGRRLGPKVLSRPSSRLLNPRHIEQAQAFVARFGPKAVVLARFVPFARTFTPVIAGVGRMSRRRFTAYNMVGAVGWSVVMVLAGSLLGGIPLIAGNIELITLGLIALALVPALVTVWRRRRSSGKGQGRSPGARRRRMILVDTSIWVDHLHDAEPRPNELQ